MLLNARAFMQIKIANFSNLMTMRIFKFGGASVKDAEGVKNVAHVLSKVGFENTLLVVSAMGKTTNALETVVASHFRDNDKGLKALDPLRLYHFEIIDKLFDSNAPVYKAVSQFFTDLEYFLAHNKSPQYSFVYDQIVSYGELLSTCILSHYFNQMGIANTWLDVRSCIKTDATYRDAQVDWKQTEALISKHISKNNLVITQGFLGADPNNFTTTLGREGSDYTAAIFAYCLNASQVTIWKDVPGVLNADPRYFEQTQLLHQISYREAIELAFYGASVIHPKTLQPLQQKEIPLYVKSFLNPEAAGTKVSKGADLEPEVPCFIVKKNQHLLSLSSRDFSFFMESHISEVFALLHKHQIKVSLMQNSAISFSVCVEDKHLHMDKLVAELEQTFQLSLQQNVSLYTIRHFTKEAQNLVETGKQILVKQILGDTIQLVVSE